MKRKATPNRKIINATPTEYNGVQFKSDLEKRVYIALMEMGVTPLYEGERFIYWEGLRPKVPFYCRYKQRATKLHKAGWVLKKNQSALISMAYTPDFVFEYEGIKVIIEVKGYESDTFPIRKKLFRAYLETLDYPVVYAEIYTLKELRDFMGILEETKDEIKNVTSRTEAQ